MMLPDSIIDFAVRTLPDNRSDWGKAMRREFEQIESSEEAFDFAVGCAWAALQERTKIMKLVTSAGRWGVGIVTCLYGTYFLLAAVNCVAVLIGQPDPYYEMLVHHHHLAAAADHLKALPFILLFNLFMGSSHLAAALFLIKRNTRPFIVACAGAGVTGAALTAIGVSNGARLDNILTWAWPFIPLCLLLAAFLTLTWLANQSDSARATA